MGLRHSTGVGLRHTALIGCLEYGLPKVRFHLLYFSTTRDSELHPKLRTGSEVYLLPGWEEGDNWGAGQEADCPRDPVHVFNDNTHLHTV